jgi:hypothetical protein
VENTNLKILNKLTKLARFLEDFGTEYQETLSPIMLMQKILKNYGQRLYDLVNDLIYIDFNTAVFNYFGIDPSIDIEEQLQEKTIKELSDIKIDCNNVLKFLDDAKSESFYKKASESLNLLFEILEKKSQFSKEEIEKKFKDLKFITEKISDWATKIQDAKSIPDIPATQMETYEELEMQHISTFPEETREHLLKILKPITQLSLAETIRDIQERYKDDKFVKNLKKSISIAIKDILFKLLCYENKGSVRKLHIFQDDEKEEKIINCKIKSRRYFIDKKEAINKLIDESLSPNNIQNDLINYIKNIRIMYSFDEKPYGALARYYNELKEDASFSMIGNIIIVNLYNIFEPQELEKYKEKGFSKADIDSMIRSEEERYRKALKYDIKRNLFEISSEIHEIDHYVDFGLPYYLAKEIIEKHVLIDFLNKFNIEPDKYDEFSKNMEYFLSEELKVGEAYNQSISYQNKSLINFSKETKNILDSSYRRLLRLGTNEETEKDLKALRLLKKQFQSILSYYEVYVRILKIKRAFDKINLELTKENICKQLRLPNLTEEDIESFKVEYDNYPLAKHLSTDIESMMNFIYLLLQNRFITNSSKLKILNLFTDAIIEQA